MKKRVVSIILAVILCVSAIIVSTVQVSARTNPSSTIWVEDSISLGKGEDYKATLRYYECNERISYVAKPSTPIVSLNGGSTGTVNCSNGKSSYNLKIKAMKTGSGQIWVAPKYRSGQTDWDNKAKINVKIYNAPSWVSLSKENITLGKGDTITISEHTNSGSYANAKNLKWTSSNNKVAMVENYKNGCAGITAKGNGTAAITVQTYNHKTDTCKITVKNAPSSVKLSKTSLTLNKGKSYTISESTNSGSYSNAAHLKWSSSNTKVATVTKGSGNKATIKAVGKGTAYIGIKTYNGKTAKCKVTVK